MSISLTRPGNRILVYRLRGEHSNQPGTRLDKRIESSSTNYEANTQTNDIALTKIRITSYKSV